MLAYVFWHRPAESVVVASYEHLQLNFHESLASAPTPGLLASRCFRVAGSPWIEQGGYEDWYLLEDYGALGELAGGAVKPIHRSAHDAAAHSSVPVCAGLYGLDDGEPLHGLSLAARAVSWIDRPAGVAIPTLEGMRASPEQGASLWHRQLVLGPTPELCLVHEGQTSFEREHWKAIDVTREAL